MTTLINPPESITHRLPSELLEQIIENVQDKSDLARLSTTCKRLHIDAQRVLYNTITLEVSINKPKIYLLLQSLFRNPALPPLVKNFIMQRNEPDGLGPPYIFSDVPEPALYPALRVLLEHALEPEYSRGREWFQRVIEGDPFAAAAFIMWMLPELKTLKIDEGVLKMDSRFDIDSAFWHILRPEIFIVTPVTTFGWSHLESLDVGLRCHPGFPLELSAFSLLKRCAHLKSVRISLKMALDWFHEPNGVTYTLPFLSKLVLSYLHEKKRVNRIGDLLTAMPNLKSFDYTCHLPMYDLDFSREAFIRSLSSVKSTLEHLRINLQWFRKHGRSTHLLQASNLIRGKLVGLQDFPSLVSLEIWATVLLGCPDFSQGISSLGALLPRNLKKLRLREQLQGTDYMKWFDKDYVELLRVFLSNWHEHTPDLEVLILEITTRNDRVEEHQVWKLLNEHSLECKWVRITSGFEYTVNLRREKTS
jgi:hypothetical protein